MTTIARLKYATFILLMALAGLACPADDNLEGKIAPSINARLLDGARFSLSDQRGKVVIINFWATWCAPCWAEMPDLDSYYKKHRSQGLEIIAISVDNPEDEAKVRKTMQKFSYPGALVGDTTIEGYGNITRVPVSIMLDHRGIIRWDSRRNRPLIDMKTLEWIVTPYLPGPPAKPG